MPWLTRGPMPYVGLADQGIDDYILGDLVVCDQDGKRTAYSKDNYTQSYRRTL